MPLRMWTCKKCKVDLTTFNKSPICEGCDKEMETVLQAPKAKFMEKTSVSKNTSNMKGQQKELLERSRNHSRDHGLDDLIQENEIKVAKDNKWLVENSNGSLRKRRKIDDI